MTTNRQTLRAKYEKNRETMNQSERDPTVTPRQIEQL